MGTDVKWFSKCRMRFFRPLSPAKLDFKKKSYMGLFLKVPFWPFRRTKVSYEAKKCFIRSVGGYLGVEVSTVSTNRKSVFRIFEKTLKNRDFSLFGPKNESIFFTIFSSPQRNNCFKSYKKYSHHHFRPLQVGRF